MTKISKAQSAALSSLTNEWTSTRIPARTLNALVKRGLIEVRDEVAFGSRIGTEARLAQPEASGSEPEVDSRDPRDIVNSYLNGSRQLDISQRQWRTLLFRAGGTDFRYPTKEEIDLEPAIKYLRSILPEAI